MDEQLLRSLRECSALTDVLKQRLNSDFSDISSCISGIIMLEYEKSLANAIAYVEEIKRSLSILQAELLELQMLGL